MSKIKGDLINRAAAIRRIKKWIDKDAKGDITRFHNRILENVIDALSEMPTADAVPVIRCKDCKNHRYKDGVPYCIKMDYGYGWKDNDFCSYAERSE